MNKRLLMITLLPIIILMIGSGLLDAEAAPSKTTVSGSGSSTHVISCDLSGEGGTIDFHGTKQGNIVGGTVSVIEVNLVDATSYTIFSGTITDIKLKNNGYVLRGEINTITGVQFGVTGTPHPGGLCSPLSDSFTISGNYGTNVPISLVTVGSAGTYTGSFTGTVTKS